MLLQRVIGNPAGLTAEEALWIATRGGADVLGRDDIGQLAPGKVADFIGLRLDTLGYAGGAVHDPLAATVFCHPQHVDLSVINGRVVVEDGSLLTLDLGPSSNVTTNRDKVGAQSVKSKRRSDERDEQLQRVNQTLKAITRVNQAILHIRHEQRRLLREVCDILVQERDYTTVWIGE